MREIKFRVWSIKNKDMIEEALIIEGTRFYNNNPNFELMQFTGLKDKNGKEIYEGDILYNQEEGNSVVEFSCGAFGVRNPKTKCWYSFAEDGEQDIALNILGNIYENPELLI